MTSIDAVPPFLQRLSAIVIFFEGSFLCGALALLAGRGAERAGLSHSKRSVPLVTAGFLAGWFGIAIVVTDTAHFPASQRGLQSMSALIAVVPFCIVSVLLFTSKTWSGINRALRPEWLIGLQVYRMAGGLFLFPLLTYGVLPGGFAWPAGLGDVITGAFAPMVAWAVAHRRRGAFGWAVAWNIFGLLDLVVAPTAAIFAGADVIALYPVALIPIFLGPPLGILLHLHSLQNLFARRANFSGRRGGSSSPETSTLSAGI